LWDIINHLLQRQEKILAPKPAGLGSSRAISIPAVPATAFFAGQVDRDRYWKARAKSEKEKAHALSIANGLRDGCLVYVDDVESKQRELAHTLKQRFAMIPGRVADLVDANGDRGRIEQVVTAKINAALSAISKP